MYSGYLKSVFFFCVDNEPVYEPLVSHLGKIDSLWFSILFKIITSVIGEYHTRFYPLLVLFGMKSFFVLR